MGTGTPVLEVTDLVVRHERRGGPWGRGREVITAVDGVSLSLAAGETLGLVGESGCGKTSLARAVLQLIRPDSGSVRFAGQELTGLTARGLRPLRARQQLVFQDPYASLDPRMRVGQSLAEPLRIHRRWREDGPGKVALLLDRVGLAPEHADRYPHELSAGQRQRIALARALALDPQVLVLDEPVSSLDVSVQAQLLTLLSDLREDLGLAYLVISHDLSVVRYLSDRIAVMSRGRIVESGTTDEVFDHPTHPVTRSLLGAIPSREPSPSSIVAGQGEVAS